jgi:hypothetical protein
MHRNLSNFISWRKILQRLVFFQFSGTSVGLSTVQLYLAGKDETKTKNHRKIKTFFVTTKTFLSLVTRGDHF